MSTTALSGRRLLALVVVALVAVLGWSAVRSGSDAAPTVAPARAATTQAGKVVIDSLQGGVKATLPLRSFRVGGTNTSTSTGGGGGAGKFVPDDPALVLDASAVDPLLLRAVATGIHIQKVTVTLFRPGTNDRQQVWELSDVTISEARTAQTGSAKQPQVSLGLRYAKVAQTTYDSGGAMVQTFCFNVSTVGSC